jgi:hypothetical protein
VSPRDGPLPARLLAAGRAQAAGLASQSITRRRLQAGVGVPLGQLRLQLAVMRQQLLDLLGGPGDKGFQFSNAHLNVHASMLYCRAGQADLLRGEK